MGGIRAPGIEVQLTRLIQLVQEQVQLSQASLNVLQSLEWRQSRQNPSSQDALRHADAYWAGGEWCTTSPVLDQVAALLLRGESTAQGHWPHQADERRGQALTAQEFLRARGLLPPGGGDWSQGHLLMWMPSFQQCMLARGVPEEVFRPYQCPGLPEVVAQAPPRNPDGRPMTPEEVRASIQILRPEVTPLQNIEQ